MASYYGKDDFVTGSDLSDFSDISEDDFQVNDLSGNSSESEDDGCQYCICGRPSTTEMIACDDDQCTVVWWHYVCAGVSPSDIPDGSWICSRCRPSTSSGSQDQRQSEDLPALASSSEAGSSKKARKSQVSTGKINKASQDQQKSIPKPDQNEVFPASASSSVAVSSKKAGKSQKSTDRSDKASKDHKEKSMPKPAAPERPKPRFQVGDAQQRASEYFLAAFERVKKHPVFCSNYPIAMCLMSLIVNLSTASESQEFKDFCTATVSSLWIVVTAGDKKKLKPESYELMWHCFHKFRLNSIEKWKSFLVSLNLYSDGQHTHIAYQYLLQAVVELMLKDRNEFDLPRKQISDVDTKTISKEEEQVLRYVAGYVPYSLYKQFNRQINTSAKIFCHFLKSWQACPSDTAKTFLEYTNQWVKAQNRGGLFHVSDGVYLLFRTMEIQTRKILSIANLEIFPRCNIQSLVIDQIQAHPRVQTYWCSLTQGKISGANSDKLLNIVIKKWIKIRTKSFLNVYLSLKKASGAHVSKKSEKALRKDL
ncbi:uncharacterized protein LOC110988470 isoform X2 [Acanthaster planci]|uniref:Uncharacterized protein LOC110988470 isoform X2 n=1 Tax=Acanthaster planci TaxID=133434 RepID=A0A8B7ZQK2_ACAPL|nr:uncharacterized protein LOC110988470 isoform X2 [Acanthaster planci]